jgi:hypothetical protein
MGWGVEMSNDAHTLTSQEQYEIREFIRARINGDPIDTWNTPVWILDMIAERDEARKWAREMYKRWIDLLRRETVQFDRYSDLEADNDKCAVEIAELRRQLEIAMEAMDVISRSKLMMGAVARDAIAKMRGDK